MENPVGQGVHPVTPPPHQPVNSHPAPASHKPAGDNSRKKTGLFAVLASIVLLVAVGVTVFLGQQNSDLRQRASETSRGSCGPLGTETILVFDRSNSMRQPATASVEALYAEESYPAEVSEDIEAQSAGPLELQESIEDEGIDDFSISSTDENGTGDENGLGGTDTTTPTSTPTSVPTSTPTSVPTSTPTSAPPTATNTPTATTAPPTATTAPNAPTATTAPAGATATPTTSIPVGGPTVPFPTATPPPSDLSTPGRKLEQAKAAMRFYVTQIRKDTRNKVGLISFGPKARVDSGLTNNYDQVIGKINNLKTSQGTCVSCAINLANSQFGDKASISSDDETSIAANKNKGKNNKNNGGNNKKNKSKNNGKNNGGKNNKKNKNNKKERRQDKKKKERRQDRRDRNNNNNNGGNNNNNNNNGGSGSGGTPGFAKAIILVSDGRANRVMRNGKSVRPGNTDGEVRQRAAQAALNAAVAGYNRHGVPFYTIALGQNANRQLMNDIAGQTGGKAYYAPSEDQLQGIYNEISNTLGQSKVSGQVYLDKNKNGVKDAGEQLLPGWTVKLIPASAAAASDDVFALGNKNKNNKNKKNKNDKNNKNNKNNKGDGKGGKNNKNDKNNKNNKNKKKKNKRKNNNNKNNRKHKNNLKQKRKKNGRNFAIACNPNAITLTHDENNYASVEALVEDLNKRARAGKKVVWTANPPSGILLSEEGVNITSGVTDEEGMTSVIAELDGTVDNYSGTITGVVEGDNDATCTVAVTTQADATGGDDTTDPGDDDSTDPTDPDPVADAPGTLTAITDANGNYVFTGICDGNYVIRVVPMDGYSVVAPPNNRHDITMRRDTALIDKDFGVVPGAPITITPPTGGPTLPEGAVQISVEVLMHGIGRSGDNANPEPPQCARTTTPQGTQETRCLSNQSPLTPNRPFTLDIQNTENTVVANGTGTLNYSATSGSFTGSAILNNQITPGAYSVKITSEKYLTRTYPGVVSLKAGQNTLRVIPLVVGDSFTGGDSKNQLDIRDYNALLGCFSITAPPKDCQFMPNQKFLTDLDDDGQVNQNDYNLFIRELSVQYGD